MKLLVETTSGKKQTIKSKSSLKLKKYVSENFSKIKSYKIMEDENDTSPEYLSDEIENMYYAANDGNDSGDNELYQKLMKLYPAKKQIIDKIFKNASEIYEIVINDDDYEDDDGVGNEEYIEKLNNQLDILKQKLFA